jgi:hypothetical protein
MSRFNFNLGRGGGAGCLIVVVILLVAFGLYFGINAIMPAKVTDITVTSNTHTVVGGDTIKFYPNGDTIALYADIKLKANKKVDSSKVKWKIDSKSGDFIKLDASGAHCTITTWWLDDGVPKSAAITVEYLGATKTIWLDQR